MNSNRYFASPLRQSAYANYQQLAPALPADLKTNPTTWSLLDNVDSSFDIGTQYKSYGPQSQASQAYMAEKCSKQWDASCEFLSMNNEICKSNMATAFNSVPVNNTVGDALVENAAERRFCDFGACNIYQQHFNPLDSSSPIVQNFSCKSGVIVCRPPAQPDDDRLLNKVLDRPDMHVELLLNMYSNSQGQRDKYKDTRIGKIFDVMDVFFKRVQPRL